jgi:hypothetical protein
VRYYLIVRAEDRIIILHARDDDGSVTAHIPHDGPILLEPPGTIRTEPFSPKT